MPAELAGLAATYRLHAMHSRRPSKLYPDELIELRQGARVWSDIGRSPFGRSVCCGSSALP
jgi:hypothetical protein